jgi:serine/threonine protein phosphatase PrpC
MVLRLMASGASDTGRRRRQNEDRFALAEPYGLYIVADGMGGHRCGATASRLAIESMVQFFRSSSAAGFVSPFHEDPRLTPPQNRLLSAVRSANRLVFERASDGACKGMGSTVVAALFDAERERLSFAHLGDSRAYCIRAGTIRRLTQDHSVSRLSLLPKNSEWLRQIATSALTRALGTAPYAVVELTDVSVRPGDLYLLCSDGLNSQLDDARILAAVGAAPTLEIATRELIAAANAAGGSDNVTVVLLRVEARVGPASG